METMDINDLLAGIVPDAVIEGEDLAPTIAPVELLHPLFDYQQETLDHLLRDPQKRYGYAGLDMGLGKTWVGIALIASVRPHRSRPSLVVVPPSLRINWGKEFRKLAPWLTIETITSSKPPAGWAGSDADVLIIGDSAMRGTGKGKKFKPTGWTVALAGKVDDIIVDEIHRFKNDSGRSAALTHVADMCVGYKVGMSGTPTPNGRHVELVRQIDFMGDGAWDDIGGKGVFYTQYAPQVDSWGGRASRNGEALNEVMTANWYFRRLRDDVLDLPNKGRSVVAIEGAGKPKKDYLKCEEDLIAFLRGERGDEFAGLDPRAEALVMMTTLRKLAGEARAVGVAQHTAEILDNEPGGVFVVAEHGAVMDKLIMKLAKYNPVTIRGGMSDKDKNEAVEAFTSGESRVMIGQVIAAGVGLTLHGDGLNHRVVVAQLPWTPADLRQAEDRLHRIGQTKDVLVEVTVCSIPECDGGWTIDERLWGALEAKAFSAGSVQDGEGTYLLEEVKQELLDSYR